MSGLFAFVASAAHFFFGAAAFLGAAAFFFGAAAFLATFLAAAFFGAAVFAAAFLAEATVRLAGRLLPRLPIVRLPFLVFLSPFPIWMECYRFDQKYPGARTCVG